MDIGTKITFFTGLAIILILAGAGLLMFANMDPEQDREGSPIQHAEVQRDSRGSGPGAYSETGTK